MSYLPHTSLSAQLDAMSGKTRLRLTARELRGNTPTTILIDRERSSQELETWTVTCLYVEPCGDTFNLGRSFTKLEYAVEFLANHFHLIHND